MTWATTSQHAVSQQTTSHNKRDTYEEERRATVGAHIARHAIHVLRIFPIALNVSRAPRCAELRAVFALGLLVECRRKNDRDVLGQIFRDSVSAEILWGHTNDKKGKALCEIRGTCRLARYGRCSCFML